MWKIKPGLIVWSLALLAVNSAHAETDKVVFGYQYGWSYTPFFVMQEQHLVEKQAANIGLDLKTEYKNLGSAGIIRDTMLAGQVQFGAVGVPTLVTLADKTDGEYKAVGNIVSAPMYLNTTENVSRICDLQGKIALPTIKTSVQAVTLQMEAKKQCGDPFALDSKTVSMTHPDGMAALLNGQVGSHLTAPPFNEFEIQLGENKVKRLFSSYEVLGGKTSFILLVSTETFRSKNPKAYDAVAAAFEEAEKWVVNNKQQAAELYIRYEKTKETPDEVLKQMSSPDVSFDITPNRIGVYAQFMKNIGTVKTDFDWKKLSFPNLHNLNGS